MVDPKTDTKLKGKIDALSEIEKLQLFRELGKKDLFFLAEYILGYSGLNRELHGELCDFLGSDVKRKLILMPRGHLKSTLGTVSYCIFQIINNPDIRILIANATFDNAADFLREIKGHFEKNETFRILYPELIPGDFRKTRWNESGMQVNRKKNLKEPTVEVVGVGGNLVSAHYDIIIGDDLVNDKNTATKDQIEKLVDWYSASLFLLEPNGIVNLIGTRWHFDDLYGRILQDKESPYVVHKRGIYKDGEPVFPEKYTLKDIKEIEKEVSEHKGRAFFVSQYLNEVIDEESAIFRRDKIKYFDKVPEFVATSLAVDPAISEKQNADYTAFTVRAVDPSGKWYIVDVFRKRGMKPNEIIDACFDYFDKWRLDALTIEAVAYQKSLHYYLIEEMQRRNKYLPLLEVKPDNQMSKEMRIKGLVPRYNNGGMFFKKSDEMTEYLLDEMFRFPKTSHDDLVDSLAMHLQIPLTSKEKKQITQKKVNRYGLPLKRQSKRPKVVYPQR